MSDNQNNDDTNTGRLAADVDTVLSKAARTVDLGRRGFVISLLVFVLLVAQLLPWAGSNSGWEVFGGQAGALPRLFVATSSVFGVVASALALATRRWWLVWVCAMGGCFAAVTGLLAVWSLQSSTANPDLGPGVGLALALATMVVLAGSWMRTAWSRH